MGFAVGFVGMPLVYWLSRPSNPVWEVEAAEKKLAQQQKAIQTDQRAVKSLEAAADAPAAGFGRMIRSLPLAVAVAAEGLEGGEGLPGHSILAGTDTLGRVVRPSIRSVMRTGRHPQRFVSLPLSGGLHTMAMARRARIMAKDIPYTTWRRDAPGGSRLTSSSAVKMNPVSRGRCRNWTSMRAHNPPVISAARINGAM